MNNNKINYDKDPYDFDSQQFLLQCLIAKSDVYSRCQNILKEKYFSEKLKPAIRYILSYSNEYRAIPDKEKIKVKTGIELNPYEDNSKSHEEWLLKEIESFCRYKAMETTVIDGIDLIQQGKGAELERRIKEAMTISLMGNLGCDYFNDPKERLEKMKDKSIFISTGWTELDKKLYGGVARGALTIFAAESGGGKSLVLQNLALNWAHAGFNVLYISLELSEELISLRLDAMGTNQSTSDVFKNMDDVSLQIALKGKQSGKLIIKQFPGGGTTTNDIRAYIKEYESRTNKRIDAVIVDYLDLLYPNSERIEVSNLFIKDKFVSEELRALAADLDILCISASQFNRESVETKGRYDQSHIAGGISKINTCDNLIAIYAPPHFKEQGKFQLKFLKTRSSSSVGQQLLLKYNPISMRLSDYEENGNTALEQIRNNIKNGSKSSLLTTVKSFHST